VCSECRRLERTGRRDPELKLVACHEEHDAYESEQGPEVVEGVLDRRASETPPVVGGNFACCVEYLGGPIADSVG
jgi:hypothetical protein